MGPALALRSSQLAQQKMGYASVAGSSEIEQLHAREGIFTAPHPIAPGVGVESCPHAAAARRAAELASALAEAKKSKVAVGAKANKPVFNAPTQPAISDDKPFNYESFYADELEKKHKDKSYRYFNNINRLAAKFPVAHTSLPEEEVTVWCANDYLGMGKNPIVLETIQYVQSFFDVCLVP